MNGRLSYRILRMPLIFPFETSFGRQTERVPIIFRLEKDGITSYSECVTDVDPFYSYESNSTVMSVVKGYLGKMVASAGDHDEFTRSASLIKGHNMAKAALEMLLWDHEARRAGKPLHSMLGHGKGYAEVGVSIGMESIKSLIARVDDSVRMGYRRIKVKIKRGREIEILSAVRDAFPDIVLTADANSDYSIKDMDTLRKIDRYNLEYIEQPFDHDDLIYHGRLAKEISTPICLDESITSPEKARKALEIEACSVINIKPGRVSGLGNSMKIAEICREFKAHVWVGGMLETGIGRSYNVSLASSSLIDYPGDTSPNSRYFHRDIVGNPFTMMDGRISLSSEPGAGYIVDEKAMKEYTVESGVIYEW
ncbi:MAG: o-succinylbenzoate synthase [Thermoplasmatales archaeon B_DKE]|nr:MAG: o-succinylbenzoate synthase [Thermoplasmatales archaeon B_DKE]